MIDKTRIYLKKEQILKNLEELLSEAPSIDLSSLTIEASIRLQAILSLESEDINRDEINSIIAELIEE